ncbi:MAG: ABC transporter permease [Candidatus Marinimicrobia bacterium]|nr:ABC transporter permease [Candidatus Neomarinimicrobiota bacterium]
MVDISIWKLVISLSILVIPFAFFLYYKIPLISSTMIAVLRMAVQLSLIAVYLEWIFEVNNLWINMLWVFLMVFVGVFTAIKRIGLYPRYFVLPLTLSAITAVIIVDAFFLGYVLHLDYLFDARYFIPITGMILGNSMNHNIVGLSTYFRGLSEKAELYNFLLTNTGNTALTRRPFVKQAITQGLNPLIATMTVIGLISLPGMMTGQILGGSSPALAIRYQIMIMLAIFIGCTTNMFLSILFSNRFIFDKFGNLKIDMVKPGKY